MQSIIRGFLTSSRRQCQAPPATATGSSVQAVSQGQDDICRHGMDKCLELACKGVRQQMHAFQARHSPKMAANKWDTLIEDVLVRDTAMHSPNEFIAENKADESIWPVNDIDGSVKLFSGCPNAASSWKMGSAMLTVPQASGIVMDTPVNPLHFISLWLLPSKQRDDELEGVQTNEPVDQDSAGNDKLPSERAAEQSIVAIAKAKDTGKSKKSSGKTCPQQPRVRKQKRKLARRPARKPCGTPNKRDDSIPGDPCMPGYSL